MCQQSTSAVGAALNLATRDHLLFPHQHNVIFGSLQERMRPLCSEVRTSKFIATPCHSPLAQNVRHSFDADRCSARPLLYVKHCAFLSAFALLRGGCSPPGQASSSGVGARPPPGQASSSGADVLLRGRCSPPGQASSFGAGAFLRGRCTPSSGASVFLRGGCSPPGQASSSGADVLLRNKRLPPGWVLLQFERRGATRATRGVQCASHE